MGRLLIVVALVGAFIAGWVVGGGARTAPPGPDPQMVVRLRQQVESLQARLRARDDLAAARPPSAGGNRSSGAFGHSAERMMGQGVVRDGGADAATAPAPPAPAATRVTPVATPSVQAALDRFYRYLETTRDATGRTRWREARELMDELRAMGPTAGQALMQVLTTGVDTDERRAAARLLGQLQVPQALPLFRDIIDRDNDLLLRRAAAVGLRQLQTPESLPVMERILTQPGEDRFVRLSAAVGLAESGRPLGVTGLAHIFDEANVDGRGRDLAFRVLLNLKDDRPLPFMRQVITSPAEPSYRLQAIRYLSSQGDQQALAALHVLMNAPNEQPSIRDAAAQAHSVISGRK